MGLVNPPEGVWQSRGEQEQEGDQDKTKAIAVDPASWQRLDFFSGFNSITGYKSVSQFQSTKSSA